MLGSADKNVIVWNDKGDKLVVLLGHKDCVRGLCVLPRGGFLSCSNDATIRHWGDDYECMREFHGHTNYIYSMSRSDFWGDDVFISSGEDSTIRMWSLKEGALGEALQVPAQSVWSVAALRNGDIVAGSSDAIVRVFTTCSDRVASQEIQDAYKLAVEVRVNESSKQLGDMDVNEIPGPESLLSKGRTGQTRIVRHSDGRIMCYKWEAESWDCVGDVMGAAGGKRDKMYEGREYDYVFSVDLSDDAPKLKLPYNRGQDPWLVAQRFIHKHNLPQSYLDQVANFITRNVGDAAVKSTGQPSTSADPFTGGSRYVPGSGSSYKPVVANTDPFTGGSSYTTQTPNVGVSNGSNAPAVVNVDPFTGGSSYSTGSTETKKVNTHFPHRHFVTMENADLGKILVKLK